MADHVVTAVGAGMAAPRIVATHPAQHAGLVNLALRDHQRTGVQARIHDTATFLVADHAILEAADSRNAPHMFLQLGYFAGFSGVLFVSDPRSSGDGPHSTTTTDWAWIALPDTPIEGAPAVYFDQPSGTQFPPRTIMTLDQARAVALEWVSTGTRPHSNDWLPVNSLRWTLDGLGDPEPPTD